MKAGWEVKALGEVVDVLDRLRKPITKKDRIEGPYPYYGATGVLGHVHEFIFDEPLVLIGEDGAKWKAGDNTAFAICGKTWVNNHAHVVRPNRQMLLDDWLIYYLNFSDLMGFITGVTVPKLNQARMREIKIPLPPLEEQKRIVAVLDAAFEGLTRARTHVETNLQNGRELFERRVAKAFGKIERANGAKAVTVADIALAEKGSIRTGPFGSQLLHSEFTEEGIAVLGIDNAVKNEFRWGKSRFISPEKYEELRRYTVKAGDVIITIMGTCGRCAVVPDDIPVSINTKHLCCITLDQRQCLPEYLHGYFLHSETSLAYLSENASGSVMDGLNMGIIKALPVYLPDVEEQAAIIELYLHAKSKSVQLQAHYRAKLQDLDDLRQSLLARAFAGELT